MELNRRKRWLGRLLLFVIALGFEVSFIHFIRLKVSQNKMSLRMEGSEQNNVIVTIIIIFFVIVANVAMIVDIFDTYTKLYHHLDDFRRIELFEKVNSWLTIRITKIVNYVFRISNSTSVNDRRNKKEDYDGWVNYVLSQTKEAIEISEYNILSDIKALESHLEQRGILS